MKRYRLMIVGVAVLFAWLVSPTGAVYPQGSVIYPVVSPPGVPVVTLSILQVLTPGGALTDVTGTWLPEPGKAITVRVNSAASSSMVLESAIIGTPFRTTDYPGRSTNVGTETDLDFSLPAPGQDPNQYIVTPLDSGGIACLRVTANNNDYIFVIPQDSDMDGIPDIYETMYCGGGATCLNPQDDLDRGPDGLSPERDGIANFDEYRGFLVNGNIERGHPFAKDVFVHFVETPQCTTPTPPERDDRPGAPAPTIQLKTFYTSADGSTNFIPLFSAMDKLMPGMVVHHIKGIEWVDYFYRYTVAGQVELVADADLKLDRQINKNALFPLPDLQNNGIVKGIRILECLDLSTTSPYGVTMSKQPPDISGEEAGTAIIFPQRIWYSFKRKFAAGAGRQVKLYDFVSGAWVQMAFYNDRPPQSSSAPNLDFLSSPSFMGVLRDAAFPFYAAHESTGHNLDLTPTVEGTTKNPAGYHHVEGTGTVIDKEIVQVIDRKVHPDGFNKFYIPSLFSAYDKRTMRLLQSQQVVLP